MFSRPVVGYSTVIRTLFSISLTQFTCTLNEDCLLCPIIGKVFVLCPVYSTQSGNSSKSNMTRTSEESFSRACGLSLLLHATSRDVIWILIGPLIRRIIQLIVHLVMQLVIHLVIQSEIDSLYRPGLELLSIFKFPDFSLCKIAIVCYFSVFVRIKSMEPVARRYLQISWLLTANQQLPSFFLHWPTWIKLESSCPSQEKCLMRPL